jgi:hypothetical protein
MSISWDAKTLSVSDDDMDKLRNIKETLDFEKDDETYKFCFSFALSRNLSPSKLPNKDKTTRWAIGSFDADGEILLAINSFFPDMDSPIEILASHAEAGIQEISRLIMSKNLYSVSELFSVSA